MGNSKKAIPKKTTLHNNVIRLLKIAEEIRLLIEANETAYQAELLLEIKKINEGYKNYLPAEITATYEMVENELKVGEGYIQRPESHYIFSDTRCIACWIIFKGNSTIEKIETKIAKSMNLTRQSFYDMRDKFKGLYLHNPEFKDKYDRCEKRYKKEIKKRNKK